MSFHSQVDTKDQNGRTEEEERAMGPVEAADSCNCDVMELLLSKKADVNARDQLGRSPIHFSALRGNLEVSRLLFEKAWHAGPRA